MPPSERGAGMRRVLRRAPASRLRRARWSALVGLAAFIAAPSGRGIARSMAQSPDAAEAQPRRHFDEGYRLSQHGDYEAAAREFATAYRLEPNPSVLFNLGHAYMASGEPVAAYDTFAEYLARAPLDAERERAVRQAMRVAEGRIGRLWLRVTPVGASVEIDGQAVSPAPLDALRLKAGRHALVLRASDLQTDARSIDIEPGADLRITASLAPPPAPQPGYVTLRCGLSDLEVRVDGVHRATSPLSFPLVLPAGPHRVVLTRSGYVTRSLLVTVTAGAGQELACDVRIEPDLAVTDASRLDISFEKGVRDSRPKVYVDGQPQPRLVTLLPSGRHRVEVKANGYQDWRRDVTLSPQHTLRLTPQLDLDAEYREESLSRQRRTRLWGGVAAGAGLALVGTAVTLTAITVSKRADWSKERDELNGSSLGDDGVTARLRENDREALVIQRLGDAALATGLTGAVALAVGTFLWLSADGGPGVQARVSLDGAALGYGGHF